MARRLIPLFNRVLRDRFIDPSKTNAGVLLSEKTTMLKLGNGVAMGFGTAEVKLGHNASTHNLRLYRSGVTKQMTGKLKISENRNIPDYKRRLLAAKYELRRKLYKAISKDPSLPSDMREKHRYKLSKLPRNSSFVRIRNRCIFSGRPRAVYELFRMSRIVFRELASKGSLMGIKKSSW